MPMHEPTIVLHGATVDLTSPEGGEFVCDACRAGEGLIDDSYLMQKYELTADDLANAIKNRKLTRAVSIESERRVRCGLAAREAAAKIFTRTPKVLAEILDDKTNSPRHRLESAKEIRATATGGDKADNAANGSSFLIRIDLTAGGGGIEDFEKVIAPKTLVANEDTVDEPIEW